jgi:phage terminase Nu1 subunit (DNA packaging protein)
MGMPKGRKAADRTTAGSSGEKADTERARLMRAKAEKAELEIAALERCLLRFDEVVQAWQQARRRVPRRCLALPSKLSSRLAVINERKKIQDALTAEIHEALQELSRFDLAGSAPARSAQSRPGSKPPAGANGKSVGRPKSAPEPRGQRRARAIPVH